MQYEMDKIIQRNSPPACLQMLIGGLRMLAQSWRDDAGSSTTRDASVWRMAAVEVEAAIDACADSITMAVEQVQKRQMQMEYEAFRRSGELKSSEDPGKADEAKRISAALLSLSGPDAAARAGLLLEVCWVLGSAWIDHAEIILEDDPDGARALDAVARVLRQVPGIYRRFRRPPRREIVSQAAIAAGRAKQGTQVKSIIMDIARCGR